MTEPDTSKHADEQPPFGASWTPLYLTVIGVLVALILLFTLFTRVFA